jgi:hypothetical protein
MSWIFGVAGKYSPSEREQFSSIHPQPANCVQRGSLYLATGGLEETCINNISGEQQESGWAICGKGIGHKNGNFSFISRAGWEQIMSREQLSLDDLDGHFTGIKWDRDKITCFTDTLGLRDIYISQYHDLIIFSTRLDWIARINKECSIDFNAFSARWLFTNQLSRESLLTKTLRLAGGVAVIEQGKITLTNKPWLPSTSQQSTEKEAADRLRQMTLFPEDAGYKTLLCLSGGIDSRVIGALLASSPKKEWETCTFGSAKHPDAMIAKELSGAANVRYTLYDGPIPSSEECIALLREYASHSAVTNPASMVVHTRYFRGLHQKNRVIMDGGFGALWRRELLNRLLWFGRKDLLNGNTPGIAKHIRRFRADIFSEDTTRAMEHSALVQIEQVYAEMPHIADTEIEKWLDIFSIRTHLINTETIEQSRLDHYVVSIMPFIQPSLLSLILSVPASKKKNGRLLRKMIADNYPAFAKYPLVKSATTHPFHLSAFSARAWSKAKWMLGRGFTYSYPAEFLLVLREFVQDTVNSSAVKQCGFYDHKKIADISAGFYNGDMDLTNQLDWWLAFEMWRQSIEGALL